MDSNVIWSVEIDEGSFKAWVTSLSNEKGTLTVESKDGVHKFTKEVYLGYGAPFGPDIEDVNYWADLSLKFIDSL